jgi:tetratricopeptide (TPR) repeat protein
MANLTEYKKFQNCSNLINEGKYLNAIRLAKSFESDYYRAAIYIDAGFELNDISKVRKGTIIFENLTNVEESIIGFTKSSVFCNTANGYSALYKLKKRKDNKLIPPNDPNLRKAKFYYRKAIDCDDNTSPPFSSTLWINYGNCLSQLGKFIHAIKCYEKAYKIDPSNGMASGNLAIELEYVSHLTSSFRHVYVALANDFMTHVFKPTTNLNYGTPNAIQDFKRVHRKIKDFINFHDEPISAPKPIIFDDANPLKNYLQFCIENDLFLNAWVGNKEFTPGVTDDISLGEIITSIDDEFTVPELLRILNEIKESFSTARYLFYLSQNQAEELDRLTQLTTYFENYEYSTNSIYIGLCKAAYARAFDILDKVARIINIYFRIGKEKDSFWRTFVEKQSLGEEHEIRFVATKPICNVMNSSLFALSDLCIEYFEKENTEFKTIDIRRNKITHEYLNVKLFSINEENDEGIIELRDLYKQTKDVLILAKYAVIYAISSINIAENSNKLNGEINIPIFYDNKLGDTFSNNTFYL